MFEKESSLQDKLMRVEGQLDSLKMTYNMEVSDYKETIERHEKTIAELNKENEEFRERIRELEAQIDNKSSSSSSDHEEKILMKDFSELQEKYSKLELEFNKITQINVTLTSEHKMLTSENKMQEETIKNTRKRNVEL